MVLLGVLTAAHRRNAVVLAARNEELERLRSVESERAVALERTRIARELHDDIAHHLTALIVRAQAAERVASSRPEVGGEHGLVRRDGPLRADGDAPHGVGAARGGWSGSAGARTDPRRPGSDRDPGA